MIDSVNRMHKGPSQPPISSRPNYTFREKWAIPAHALEELQRYITQRIRPGGFIYAVLVNDLYKAVSYADDEVASGLPAFVGYLTNETDGRAYGSKAKVDRWLAGEEE